VSAGDPIFLAPEYRVDLRLTHYVQSRTFRSYTAETRRNHANDLRLFLSFLSSGNVAWKDAAAKDVKD
jgi:hypothetical protein